MKRRDSMTTPENTLQPSEKLAPFVAPYRDEAPLVSTSEINAMLANRDRLPTRSSHTIRKAIMTLAGLTAIGLVLYQVLSVPTSSQRTPLHSTVVHRQHALAGANIVDAKHEEHRDAPKSSPLATRRDGERPPYAAPGDQIFADLTPEQLARLGITLSGDTISQYNLNHKGEASVMKLTAHFFEGSERVDRPNGVSVSKLSPVLMTRGDGQSAAFHYEEGDQFTWTMINDDPKEIDKGIEFLKADAVPGLQLLSFATTNVRISPAPGLVIRKDTVRIEIGNNVPALIGASRTPPTSFPDSIRAALTAYASFLEGRSAKPNVSWPQNFFVVVDTVTALDLIKRYDQEHNSTDRTFIRQTLARLNQLVPVLVRVDSKTGNPSANDFIFWYEPSEQLFAALPPAVAALFQKPLSHTYCLTAPNSISQDAEITYCVPEAQQVEAIVQDLVGHIFRIVLADAHAGDNTLSIPTEVLPSGMYIVTLRMKDGSQQSRRIWSQNDSPTPLPTSVRIDMPAHTNDHRAIYTFPQNYRASTFAQDIQAQRGNEFENLDIDSFLSRQPNIPSDVRKELQKSMKSAQGQLRAANNTVARNSDALKNERATAIEYLSLDSSVAVQSLGVENQDVLVAYYRTTSDLSNRVMFGVVREWGLITTQVAASSITHPTPSLYPTIVTDALGRKRMIETTSDTVINELVPVLFRRPGTQDSLGGRDIVFWYEPTSEFLAALPDSSRQSVRAMMGTRSVPNAQLRTALHGIRTYPNPSHGAFALDLTLDAPRKVSAIVRNLLGQERARRVIDAPQGTSTEHFSFDALEDGIYLLELTTDAGETQFQRIVIEH